MDGLNAILSVVAGILAVIAGALPLIAYRNERKRQKNENISGVPGNQAKPDGP